VTVLDVNRAIVGGGEGRRLWAEDASNASIGNGNTIEHTL